MPLSRSKKPPDMLGIHCSRRIASCPVSVRAPISALCIARRPPQSNGQQSHQRVVAGGETTVVVETIGVDVVGLGVWRRIRLLSITLESPYALVGKLIIVLAKATNFVISTDWALAAKTTSLLRICTLVARKYPAGSL